MKSVQKIDLGLTGYDELFMNDAERKENKLPRIYDIPISEIDDFPDHPFKVKLDEDMDQLVQSIKERGIITPVTLRPKEDGRYEIVSGHRRKKACELAGFDTVKAEVREMTRDEAIILMVESNLQRSVILPSEKAFSYKMRLEAMKRQGQRTDLTLSPVETKLRSSELIAQNSGDSRAQVDRYIRLTELIPELLDLVDEGRIAFRPAVELSYLQKEEQSALLEQIAYVDATPSLAQAIKLKRFSQDGKLNNEVIESIMSEEKPNQREKINIKYAEARRFIPASVPYLLVTMYAKQYGLATRTDDEKLIGARIDAVIPELRLAFAFSQKGTDREAKVEEVLRFLCKAKRIQLFVIRQKDPIALATEIKQAFTKANLFIHSDSQRDVAHLRKRYFAQKNNGN